MAKHDPMTAADLGALRELCWDISADESGYAKRLERDLTTKLPDVASTAQAVSGAIHRLNEMQRGLLARLALVEHEAELRERLSPSPSSTKA